MSEDLYARNLATAALKKAKEGGSSVSALNDLSDVSINNPSNGQVLKYGQDGWINGDAPAELPSVSSTDNGKVLGVVEGAWEKMDAPSGGGGVVIYNVTNASNRYYLPSGVTVNDLIEDINNGKEVLLINNGFIYHLYRYSTELRFMCIMFDSSFEKYYITQLSGTGAQNELAYKKSSAFG